MAPTLIIAILALAGGAFCVSGPFHDPQTWPGRNGIVHLFEWKWLDIANECEQFLAPKGYAAVQISPPTENLVVFFNGIRPWWERYQPLSYRLLTRSGNEQQFEEMTRRCNAVGVRIYVDLVINHMTKNADNAVGTGGSSADANGMSYPAVPFTTNHFHKPQCAIRDYGNPVESRNCEMDGLHDLDHSQQYVRDKVVGLLNHLIDLGVAGFRVDAAKLIWPNELLTMMESTNALNTKYGFAPNTKPFVFLEVIDMGNDPIPYQEYIHIGRIIDFRSSAYISRVFRGEDQLRFLRNWGVNWNLVYGPMSVVFVDNHDNQREEDGRGPILNYKRSRQYKMAVAFVLAFPHGMPRIMSSYYFENFHQGPPSTPNGDIISPGFGVEGVCTNGYVCEHRWRQVYNMIAFKNIAGDTPVENWWDNGGNQIVFSRGNKAFIAINNDNKPMYEILPTGLPEGTYCDIMSGEIDASGRGCTGKVLKVGYDTKAAIYIGPDEMDGVVAVHINSRTRS